MVDLACAGTVTHVNTHQTPKSHISRAKSRPKIVPIPDRYLTYDDLAAVTGYSVHHLRHMKMVGNFPPTTKLGCRVLVHPDDFAVWLASRVEVAA